MRLLKENYEGLQGITQLSPGLKEFLSKPEVQEALQRSDFGALYQVLPLVFASNFTRLLNSLDIDPLDYLDYIPIRFLANTSVKYITIPNHVRSISSWAFHGCSNLTGVTIGSGVTSIGSHAFWECIKLTSINYAGTKEQWSKIKLENGWNANSPIETIHCTDGDIKL